MRWKTYYEVTNPQKVFKTCYILSAIFGIFAFVGGLLIHYDNAELNKAKWKGLGIGCVSWVIILALVYLLCNAAGALIVGIILFICYAVHIPIFGFLYNKKTDITQTVNTQSADAFMEVYRELALNLGKIHNFEKYNAVLRKRITQLQGIYGYSLKDANEKTLAYGLYYLLDADSYIFDITQSATTNEIEAGIIDILCNSLNDELLDDNPDLFIQNIVGNYFSK